MPRPITNRTTATLIVTIAALNLALSLMPMTRIAVMTSAIKKAGRLKPISTPKIVGALRSPWAWLQSAIRSLGHLARDNLRSGAQPRPVVIGQPQRHLDIENIEQLDEVVGPSRGNRARAHGVFQREIPADDP